MVLVAHPDDESIACGGLLQKMRDPFVVFATDGAPEDEFFWGKHGSRAAYSKVRQQEARAALAHVGVHEVKFLVDDATNPAHLVDQRLFRAIPETLELLRPIVQQLRPQALLTLAYEGGHPDHDTCSFLSSRLGSEFHLPVWEAPLYHRTSDGGGVYQRFVNEQGEVIEYSVNGEDLERKQRMLGSYKSQFDALPHFRADLERFRPQFPYDYKQPPHAGRLNYEVWEWKMTGREVSGAFAAVLSGDGRPRRQ